MKTLLEFLLVAAPKVMGGVLTLGANLLLLRVFPPELYAVYFICITTIIISDAIVGGAVDMGALREASGLQDRDPAKARSVQYGAVQLKAAISLIGAFLLLGFAEPASNQFLHGKEHAGLLRLAVLATLTLLLHGSVLVRAQIQREFRRYGLLEWVHQGAKFGGVGLLLLLDAATPARVLACFVLGPALAASLGLWLYRDSPIFPRRFHGEEAKRVFAYSKWFLATVTLGMLVSRMDLFLLTSWGSLEEAGVFSGAYVFATVPLLIGQYLGIVFGPRIMPLHENRGFRSYFVRTQVLLYGLAALIWAGASLGLSQFGGQLLPAEYTQSIPLIQILLPGALLSMVTVPLAMTLVLFVQRRFLFLMDFIAAPILPLLYYWVIPDQGAQGAAMVTSGSLIVRGLIAQGAALYWGGRPSAVAGHTT